MGRDPSGPGSTLLLLQLLFGLAVAVVAAGAVPTSVLTNVKEASAHHHGGSDAAATQSHQAQQQSRSSSATFNPGEVKNQISVPQKRGVNPLLYNDFDYSGNSIPHGGVWDDLNAVPSSSAFGRAPPLAAAAALFPDQLPLDNGRVRNYDLLASLLGPPPPPAMQTFYGDPVTPSVSYPYVFGHHGGYGDRSKRMASSATERNPLRSLRLKRSPSKLTAADALSLLALLESRDPYPSMADYYPLLPAANGPNDVLPYPPNSMYQEIPLSLALAQLGGGASRNTARLAPYSDDDGEWMNTWTEPSVDYLGFPVDVDTLSRLDNLDTKPTKNGISHQKRFMITKKKRSVSLDADNDDCKNGSSKKTCLLRKYGQLAATKVAPA